MPDGRDLLHRRTRDAFRESCSDFGTVRKIERAFENEGFTAAPDDVAPQHGWYTHGERRGTFDRYAVEVAWSNSAEVQRILAVFEEILRWTGDAGDDLRRYLQRDGCRIDDSGRIRLSAAASMVDLPLATLNDAAAIYEHLDRIVDAAPSDPALAISGAKAVIEATAKRVLVELGQAFDEHADIPALVRAAQQALLLHPDDVAPTARGAQTIKRILGGLSSVAIGVAELRNEYGPDHGRSTPTMKLSHRHANLAIGCATTYCRMLLETLEARRTSGEPTGSPD